MAWAGMVEPVGQEQALAPVVLALLEVLLFLFLLQSQSPIMGLLEAVVVAAAAAATVVVSHKAVVAVAVSVHLRPTLLAVADMLLVALEHTQPLAVAAVEKLPLLSFVAPQSPIQQDLEAVVVLAERVAPQAAAVVQVVDRVDQAAAQSQEIQTSLGWLQEQDSGASHEHHLFF